MSKPHGERPERHLAVQAKASLPAQASPFIPAQAQLIMEALNGNIPEEALDHRTGRSGQTFTYVTHGYVTDMLNKTFGPFWDWRLVPVRENRLYDIVDYTEEVTKNMNVTTRTVHEVIVSGVLTIRIHDAASGQVIETITRSGEGGKVWEARTTFADAFQAASSDAFKRAAFRLGRKFGLELYYDSEERQQEWLEKIHPKPPASIVALFMECKKRGISDEALAEAAGKPVDEIEQRDIEDIWKALVDQVDADHI